MKKKEALITLAVPLLPLFGVTIGNVLVHARALSDNVAHTLHQLTTVT